eukprot:superscaffoldBa00000535_g5475
MAQISSGNGFKLDVPQPKGVVGKEEALRMEEEALAKLQREKRHTLSASTSLSSSGASSSSSKPKPSKSTTTAPQPQPSACTSRPEKDLIVFPETKKQVEQDKFRDIDVDKLTNEELEKLLLDENFGANSKVTRPSSLLGFDFSASYPGGHPCSSSPFQSGQWTPVLSTPSSSSVVSTPTHQPSPLFPSAPFPKPGTFQNGFTPTMSPFMALPAQQPSFMAFTPIQPAAAMVFPQPAVDPEMAKLFDKIASTSEYLKNGRSASTDLDSSQAFTVSLAPNPPPQQPAVTESSGISRFDWLDLDPLTKRKAESEEASPASGGAEQTVPGLAAGDPWDAVLETEENSSSSSPPPEGKASLSVRSQHRRASIGAAVTRSHSLNIPGTSSPHKPNNQDKGKGKGLVKNAALEEQDAQNLEVVAFCEDVATLRTKFPHGDMSTNPGYVLSPVITQRDSGGDTSCSVKVSIEISESQQPVTFTCDVSSPVELLISQTLCWVHDDLDQVDFSSYLLKVCGQEEVLQNKHSLGSHEYVQNCRKWENEITLQLLSHSTMRRDLARNAEDDNAPIHLEKYLGQVERPFKENVTRQGLADYLEGYHNQVSICLQNESTQYKTVDRVVQTVKNLCCALDEVETQAITEAVKRLRHSVNLPRTRSPKMGSTSSGQSSNGHLSPVEESMSLLTQAVYDLAKLYLRSFCPPSTSYCSPPLPNSADGDTVEGGMSSKEASGTTDHLQFTLFALHGVPPNWVDFPNSAVDVLYVGPKEAPSPEPSTLEELDPDLRRKLEKICSRASNFGLKRADHQLLWDHRLHCRRDHPSSIPKVLASAPSWDWASMAHIHSLLHHWPTLPPAALQEGLENVQNFFQRNSCRLPLSPSLVAKELNLKACSFFNSNAVPLKLALVNADPLGEEINVMFKVGEDLRQDMLALQMIRIMDRIWLQEGLDLRIVNFKCISTGKDKGMVELVPSSDTLRKIQVEYGVTGSFKDKPLAEWLRKYNPAEDEYEKASENFIYSCAGCCVATYVLGICDRHNDNIMLRSTGHMFHIDFGKFLGHAQMFGSFKRDRAPFVLTSDMAYVINGGERPTSRFQLFVDLCCQAYNLIRKHSGLFLNLLSLMTSSGLPELTGSQDLKYVFDALQPHNTDAEATIFFTRLIESSLGSVATKFNFFIHNLAQLRFSGLPANDEPILSFSPKTYTLKQEGRILHASIFSFQKRYNPDKHYTYVVRILRDGQNEPQFVFRTFDEFQELHNKLTILFPLWKLPSFPNKMVLGRTHIKEVAAKRKLELNNYVHNLMRSSTECDLIYTFFHPIARDDKTEGLESTAKAPEPPLSPTSGRVEGEVKLSISYRNSTLFIMVMHIRDLVSEDGTDPNPYVKTYLLPDPHKTSKRKTKISRKTRNPTFNEMLVYNSYSKESLGLRELQLSVLSAESLRENYFLGGITLRLKDFDLSKETVKCVNTAPRYAVASLPTQAQNTFFCRVCGLSSSTAIMGRMHAPGKGLSQSALPYRRSVPTWLKLTSDDVKEQIFKLAKKGLTPSQIGVILRDSHGVAQVRFVTGNKILRILKSKGLAPDLPEDLYHLIKKAVAVRKHLERNRKDKDAKFRLILIESRIHRLARYYKTKRVLAPNWK